MAKLWYRRQKMERKKGKDNFTLLVKECFGRSVLSIESSRELSRRARQYMVSYYML
jgi:C4-type Zn-finger protein